MNSRERIISSIDHKQPDKVPIDLGSSTVTGISGIAYNNLKKYLKIKGTTRIYDVIQQLANVDMEIIDLFGVDSLDFNRLSAESNDWYEVRLADGSIAEYPSWFRPVRADDGSCHTYDEDGILISKMATGATFFDQMHYPYENGYPADFSNLKNDLKKIIWMELLLLGASILIFRSVWSFLDKMPWASGKVGLTVLLVAGVVAAVFALRNIEALSGKKGDNSQRPPAKPGGFRSSKLP